MSAIVTAATMTTDGWSKVDNDGEYTEWSEVIIDEVDGTKLTRSDFTQPIAWVNMLVSLGLPAHTPWVILDEVDGA